MTFRTFLPLLTYPDAGTVASVRNAVAFARLLGNDLHALTLEVDIPDVSSALSRAIRMKDGRIVADGSAAAVAREMHASELEVTC